jgi:hypothetical protein
LNTESEGVPVKRTLAKLIPNKAIGLYVSDSSIIGSLVSGTPFGVVELATHSEAYEPENLAEAIQRVLHGLVGRGKVRSYPVMLGLASSNFFFSTRPMRTEANEVSPQVLLHEALQSSGLLVEDMVVESLKAQPGKRTVVSLVSCRKKYLSGLLAAAQQCGLRHLRVEPALCGLLRAGAYRQKAPRRSNPIFRLFLGETKAMGIVAVGNSPLIWRHFEFPAEEKRKGICAAVRTMQTLTKPCGVDMPLEVLMLHGPASQCQRFDNKEFADEIGLPVLWCEGPGLEDAAIAHGLAIDGLNPSSETLDLARSLKPRPLLRDIFPWKEVVLELLLLAGMAVYLTDRSSELHANYLKVQAENEKFTKTGSVAISELDKEKKDLVRKTEAFRSFVGTRVLWSKYTSDISEKLPANVTLSSMQGVNDLDVAQKGTASAVAKKSFILRASVPLGSDGEVPPEIDGLLTALKRNPLLHRDFPNIELTDIKSTRVAAAGLSSAAFTIVCLQKSQPVAAAKKPGNGNPSGK